MPPSPPHETIAVVGDLHGHLQLALCVMARWQRTRDGKWICPDLVPFVERGQLEP